MQASIPQQFYEYNKLENLVSILFLIAILFCAFCAFCEVGLLGYFDTNLRWHASLQLRYKGTLTVLRDTASTATLAVRVQNI